MAHPGGGEEGHPEAVQPHHQQGQQESDIVDTLGRQVEAARRLVQPRPKEGGRGHNVTHDAQQTDHRG